MKKILLFCLLFQLLQPSSGKSQPFDNGLIWMLRDTVKIIALIDSGWKANYSNPNMGLRIAQEATFKSINLKWEKGTAKAMLLAAKAHDLLGNFQEALQIDFQALTISKRISDRISEANSLRQIGGMYQALCDYPSAIHFLRNSYNLSVRINYLKGMASSLSDLGFVYKCKSDLILALKYYNSGLSIKIKIKDYKNIANSYRQIGMIYSDMGDYEKGIDYELMGLKLSQKIGDKPGEAIGYGYIGEFYLKMVNYKKALYYLYKSLKLKTELMDKFGISMVNVNIGTIYSKTGNEIGALSYFNKALAIHCEINDTYSQSLTFSRIGSLYEQLNQYDSAICYYKKGVKIDLQLRLHENLIEDYINLAKSFINLKSINVANNYLKLVLNELTKHSSLLLGVEYHKLQSQLLEKQGKFKASLIAYKRFITLRDSAINQNKKIAVALKEVKYEFDKKALADSLKNNEAQKAKDLQIKFKDSELQKQKLKQNAMLAGIVVLFVLGWLLYSRYKAVSLQQVSERKLMLLEKEQALVEERTRIADEMHDDVGADLSNLLLKIRMNEHTQTQSAAQTVDLGGLKNSTNSIIHKIDEIIWSLNSHRDTLQELVNFIVKYYDTILQENNLSGKATVQETLPTIALASKQRRNIYLTVKEILNNALKHAQAKSIHLTFAYESNILEIKICDNGIGFDSEKSFQGNGLRNMRKRLEMVDGKLEIKSTPNSGSKFLMHIPVV